MPRVAAALRKATTWHVAAPHVQRAIMMGDITYEVHQGSGGRTARRRVDRVLGSALQA